MKIGPGRPRKNRMKKPHEDPKKAGKLTTHGLQMSCSVCKSTGHNKRRCPDKDKDPQELSKSQKINPPTEPSLSQNAHSSSLDHFEGGGQPSVTFEHDQARVPFVAGRGGRGGRGSRGGKAGESARGGKRKGVGKTTPIADASSSHPSHSNIHNATAQPTSTGRGNKVIKSRKGSRGGKDSSSKGKKGNQNVPKGFGILISSDGCTIMNEPGQNGGPRILSQEPPHIGTLSSVVIQ